MIDRILDHLRRTLDTTRVAARGPPRRKRHASLPPAPQPASLRAFTDVHRLPAAARRRRGDGSGCADRRDTCRASSGDDALRRCDRARAPNPSPFSRGAAPRTAARCPPAPHYLNGMTSSGDPKVGRDAIGRYGVLKKELDAIKVELSRLLGPVMWGV